MIIYKKLKISLLVILTSYILMNLFVYLQGRYYWKEYQRFDINNNSLIEKEERTIGYEKAFRNVTHDTARSLAPITLIPVSLFLGFIVFLYLFIHQ